MLQRFFHAWEHRLASATKDRVLRPFEWGADWLPANGHPSADDALRIARWVDDVMGDTAAFFTPPPTADYRYTPSQAALARRGEAGTLEFPSALVTPHPENNVVRARWFPAPGEH